MHCQQPPHLLSSFPIVENLWDEKVASSLADDLDRLVYLSHLLGRDPAITQPGGGNTSLKRVERDFAGREVELLRVKGSGTDLATIGRRGFTGLRLADVRLLRDRTAMTDEEMMAFLAACMTDPREPAPSVETPLHSILTYPCIAHTHDLATQALTDTSRKLELVREALGDEVACVGYIRPGFPLARAVMELGDLGKARGLVLGKHGLVAWGGTPRECYENLHRLISRAEAFIAKSGAGKNPFEKQRHPPAEPAARRARARDFLPLLRGRLARPRRVLLHLDDSEDALRFVHSERSRNVCRRGMATPEHILRCGRLPLLLDAPDQMAAALDEFAAEYETCYLKHAKGQERLDPVPKVILVPGLGVVTAMKDKKNALLGAQCYRHVIRVIEAAERLDQFRFLDEGAAFEMEHWSLELAKLRQPELELARRVALVTGAAGGIGRAIAERFAAEGAHVVLTDLDAEAVKRAAEEIGGNVGDPARILGVRADATSEQETAAAVEAAVLGFGGLDILVCNAGYIKPAAIEKMGLDSWERHFDINSTGCFLASREAARVMRAQGTGGVILFNVSKAACAPTIENAAYAASKAAAAHLARCLAAELGPAGIRVNSFNADAIDTPLFRRHVEERAKLKGVPVEEQLKTYRQRNLLKLGPIPPSAVAEAAFFLASDRSAYTTGGVLTIDGGLTDAMPR